MLSYFFDLVATTAGTGAKEEVKRSEKEFWGLCGGVVRELELYIRREDHMRPFRNISTSTELFRPGVGRR